MCKDRSKFLLCPLCNASMMWWDADDPDTTCQRLPSISFSPRCIRLWWLGWRAGGVEWLEMALTCREPSWTGAAEAMQCDSSGCQPVQLSHMCWALCAARAEVKAAHKAGAASVWGERCSDLSLRCKGWLWEVFNTGTLQTLILVFGFTRDGSRWIPPDMTIRWI